MASESADSTDAAASVPSPARQRIEKTARRRARLTAAPGTSAEPRPTDEGDRAGTARPGQSAAETGGPNDERMRREVPPHY